MTDALLLTGAAGLLGTWLRRTVPIEVGVVSLSHRRPLAGDAVTADLRDRAATEAAFDAVKPQLVIHAAFARDEASIVDATRPIVQTLVVPSITGHLEINLTVRDPERSAAWYTELLGMQTRYDHTSDDGAMRYISLVEPASELVLCVVGHLGNGGEPFSELRTGLDHLEFLVASRNDLDQWAERLDQLGVSHSGVRDLGYTPNAMLTFRDPDNIQLEFFWRAAKAARPTGT